MIEKLSSSLSAPTHLAQAHNSKLIPTSPILFVVVYSYFKTKCFFSIDPQ